jgi:translocator protein
MLLFYIDSFVNHIQSMMRIVKLIVALLLPLAVGALAGRFTASAIPGWYATLNQPSFNPPNWVFAPVWTALYLLMGISFYLIWQMPPNRQRNRAIAIFLGQLALNFAWSFLFFYFKRIGWALVDIVLLWASIAAMLWAFYKLKPWAAWINVPYILWVSFATALNMAYYWLNG